MTAGDLLKTGGTCLNPKTREKAKYAYCSEEAYKNIYELDEDFKVEEGYRYYIKYISGIEHWCSKDYFIKHYTILTDENA